MVMCDDMLQDPEEEEKDTVDSMETSTQYAASADRRQRLLPRILPWGIGYV